MNKIVYLDMKNILIISATLKNNYELAKDLSNRLEKLNIDTTLISLEDYKLPIYTDSKDIKDEHKEIIDSLAMQFPKKEGLIICGPEYNGSTHPIINNSIAWISSSTDYWRDAFSDKIALVATYSGGAGLKYISTMKLQLEHLGCVVMPRAISSNKSNPMNSDSIDKILKQFVKLL